MDDNPLTLTHDLDPAAPTVEGGDAPAGGGAEPSQASGTAAADQLGILLSRALEPMAGAMEQRFAAQDARLNQLADHIARTTAQQPNGAAPANRESKIESFVSDPDAYEARITKQATEAAMKAIAPYLRGPANNAQQTTLAAERSSIDSEFGDGSFDKFIKPHIDTALQHMPEAARFDPDALRTSVAALAGSSGIRGQLAKAREEHQRKLADAAKKRPAVPNIFGPSRPVDSNGRPTITPEDRIVLDALENQGYKFEESELRTIRGFSKGMSLDDMHEQFNRKAS